METTMKKLFTNGIRKNLNGQSVCISPLNTNTGHVVDISFRINNHAFTVNLLTNVYRTLPEEAGEDMLETITGYYTGTIATEKKPPFIPATKITPEIWTKICMFDNMIDWAKKDAYLMLQEIFFDQTPAYTPTRFANRVLHVFTTMYAFAYNADLNPEMTSAMAMDSFCWMVMKILDVTNIPHEMLTNKDLAWIGAQLYPDLSIAKRYPFSISAKGIQVIKKKYDSFLCDMLQLERFVDEGKDPEYYTRVFPNYEDPYGVTIYTQIGFPEKGFLGSDVENWSFSLSVNPMTFTCKYTNLDPETDNHDEIDVFHPDPRLIEEPRKSVLALIGDALFNEIILDDFKIYETLYTTGNPGLTTPTAKVTEFADQLLKKICLDYPKTKKEENSRQLSYQARPCNDGVTLIAIGSVFLAVAIDGIGLVDIALDREITPDMTWDDIFYNVARTEDVLADLSNNFELTDWLIVAPQNDESKLLLSEIGTLCASVLYQMSNEEEKEHE